VTRVALVVGARPNYFKAKPILARLDAHPRFEALLVHTGQHHDASLFEDLFAQLDLRAPDVYLGERDRRLPVADMIQAFSAWIAEAKPDAVVVVGDVDSTVSSALAAHYSGVPVAHVEAGLRSRDRSMPEEINRLLTDAVSGLLLVSDPAGVENLAREGRSGDEVVLVGNVMIDTLLERLPVARARALPPDVAAVVEAGPFGLLTLHRPGNVDDGPRLERWCKAIVAAAARIPLVFPVHPRTRRRLDEHGLSLDAPGLLACEPLGYLEVIALQDRAQVVLSDSAGITEESSVLGTPVLTLRPNTERPVTLEKGTAVLVPEPEGLAEWLERALEGPYPQREGIALWDGRAGERTVAALEAWLPA
jgi:UDP-N-acetylglucosamine 2-epimerase (non-hydrolysing)